MSKKNEVKQYIVLYSINYSQKLSEKQIRKMSQILTEEKYIRLYSIIYSQKQVRKMSQK